MFKFLINVLFLLKALIIVFISLAFNYNTKLK